MSPRITRILLTSAMTIMVACGSGDGSDKDDSGEDGAGGDINIGDDGDVVFDDDVSPVLVEGRAWCQAGSDSSGRKKSSSACALLSAGRFAACRADTAVAPPVCREP